MPGRTYTRAAVVLRSLRFGEADRVLHLYTLDRGRVGAVAKGVRKTKSRFGARLEPLSHAELVLHQGGGELHTVTGVDLIRPHHSAREDGYRLAIGLIGLEALLRFLDLLDELPLGGAERPALDPLALSFQLKLLWLNGYLPHLTSCANCGRDDELVGYSPRAGGAVCRTCAEESLALSPGGRTGIEALLRTPLADAARAGLDDRAQREALAVITSSYEFHGGFRLRTLKTA